jgi:5'-methylthioadenosine phosphorylase
MGRDQHDPISRSCAGPGTRHVHTCVALVTDHDIISDSPWPVTQDLVREGLDANTKRLREALLQVAIELAHQPETTASAHGRRS